MWSKQAHRTRENSTRLGCLAVGERKMRIGGLRAHKRCHFTHLSPRKTFDAVSEFFEVQTTGVIRVDVFVDGVHLLKQVLQVLVFCERSRDGIEDAGDALLLRLGLGELSRVVLSPLYVGQELVEENSDHAIEQQHVAHQNVADEEQGHCRVRPDHAVFIGCEDAARDA